MLNDELHGIDIDIIFYMIKVEMDWTCWTTYIFFSNSLVITFHMTCLISQN